MYFCDLKEEEETGCLLLSVHRRPSYCMMDKSTNSAAPQVVYLIPDHQCAIIEAMFIAAFQFCFF